MKRMISVIFSSLLLTAPNTGASETLDLKDALELLQKQNLEIKIAEYDIKSAESDIKKITGSSYGKLDLIQDYARSNDAGNVFGFKLTSREASFKDFGFNEFLAQMPSLMGGVPGAGTKVLSTQPKDLNYPGYRDFYQTKIKYELPIFTGFMLSNYEDIMHSMKKISSLQKEKVLNEKRFELRKSFYNMAVLDESYTNLQKIVNNIDFLETMTKNMIDEGYAKSIDLLEVISKKANIERMIANIASNKELLLHYISFLLNKKVSKIQTPQNDIASPLLTQKDIAQNNIDIKKATEGLEVRKNMINVSKSAYYPMVGGFAEVATADDELMNDMDDKKAYTIGARLTWNLFNGGSDNAEIEKSRVEHIKMQTQLELAKKGIALQYDKLKTELETLDNEIDSIEKELRLADAIYENYLGRYKEKLSSMSDVIIKQSQQIEKILELQMVKNKRNQKIFELEKLANIGDEK